MSYQGARHLYVTFVLFLVLGRGGICMAQYDVRMSQTGSEAAAARKESKKFKRGSPNLRLGPLEISFGGGLTQEYNDNIGLSQTKTVDDIIMTPSLGIGVAWPVTALNGLNASLGLGYAKYMNHPEFDSETILIQPDSAGEFDFYIKDVRFTVSSRMSLQQDPATVAQLSNLTTFRRLTTAQGLNMEWDLNKIFVSGGYQRDAFKSLENERFTFLNHTSHSLNAMAGVRISPTLNAGVLSSYSYTTYEESTQNGSNGYSSGLFASMVLTEYLSTGAMASFQGSDFERGGKIGDNTDFGSMVYSLSLAHKLNRWVDHSVAFRRFTTLGIGSNFTDIREVTYDLRPDILRDIKTTFSFGHQWSEDSQSLTAEKRTNYTLSTQLGYQLMEATMVNLTYQRTEKASDRLDSSYEQNRVTLAVSHQF